MVGRNLEPLPVAALQNKILGKVAYLCASRMQLTHKGSTPAVLGLCKVLCLRHCQDPLRRVNLILGRRNFIQVSCVADVSEGNATGIQDRITL